MKTYTEEFKNTLAKLAESGRPTMELSREYGVSKSTINVWRRKYRDGDGKLSGKSTTPPSAEDIRIRNLEKQVRELTLERDILKKAVRIFSAND